MTNGTLVNAPDGTIRANQTAPDTGGLRELHATLDNQGLLDLSGTGLLWQQSAQSTNSGRFR